MPAARRARRAPTAGAALPAGLLDRLEWRCAGPYRGGRVGAVAGDPRDRNTFYFGSTGGGVWKSQDAGLYWENVSDGFLRRASVGAIAVAPSDPNVVYVGMGESCIRSNVSHGDGVYRSTDGGKTWTHLGLEGTRHIGNVSVHPGDAETVYVAALGHAHGPNPERGVYRSRDGGRTWKRVLYRGERAGAVDLSLDPRNPRIVFAAVWEAIRRPWELVSGGPGSGIFRSADGGDTWTDITRAKGLPRGVLGKTGIAASPAQSGRVYAIVEAEDGAVFRSDDGGDSWERCSEARELRYRAWYYQHIHADPLDAETVWVLNIDAWRSSDGGKTFVQSSIPHGDHHDLWIDPADPRRMIEGNDGGAVVSLNGGESWTSPYNQPTAELYHVTTDTQTPYRIYGAQQDNSTLSVPSRGTVQAITGMDAYSPGGGECGYVAVRPDDPSVVYSGNYQGAISRYDRRTGQFRNIMAWPEQSLGEGAAALRYRFQWTAPIVLSPHDPNVLYHCGNRVLRTRDEGVTWEAISPDLTRDDRTKLGESGGPVTKDNTGAEYYCTVFAFAESPKARGVLWAGSDDGLVHLSRDDGKTWRNVTPKGLASWALISIIDASPHDAGAAYLAATRYKLDDFRPYLFRTRDWGRTWTKIVRGIPADDFTRVIRADPERRGLIYAGTETGVYVSFDDGGRWHRLGGNLPLVPIHDLVVKDSDLVLATHGRSFWVLDDVAPFRQQAPDLLRERAHVFAPSPTVRVRVDGGYHQKALPGKNYRTTAGGMMAFREIEKPTGAKVARYIDAGQNPPDGVMVRYWLRSKPEGALSLTFLDARGRAIRTFTSARESGAAGEPTAALAGASTVREPKEPTPSAEAGLNHFVWDTRLAPAVHLKDGEWEEMETQLLGPQVVPGAYRARLTVSGVRVEAALEIRKDPRVPATAADFEAQFALRLAIRDKLSETHAAVNGIRAVRAQIDAAEVRAKDAGAKARVARAAASLRTRLAAVEEQLVQTKAKSRSDNLAFPVRLNVKLGALGGAVSGSDFAPTQGMRDVFADLSRRIDAQLAKWKEIREGSLPAFERLVRSSGVPAVSAAASGSPTDRATPSDRSRRTRGRAPRAPASRARARRRSTR